MGRVKGIGPQPIYAPLVYAPALLLASILCCAKQTSPLLGPTIWEGHVVTNLVQGNSVHDFGVIESAKLSSSVLGLGLGLLLLLADKLIIRWEG